MVRWARLLIALDLILLFSAGAWIYSAAGLKQFLKAQQAIRQIPDRREKEQAFREFYWYEPQRTYGGILAGDFFGRIWVWGKKGLRSFAADEDSVYSWFDGCSPEVLARMRQFDPNDPDSLTPGEIIGRETNTDFDKWRQKTKNGAYVRVILADKEMGGKTGNLREAYGYNFWLFIRNGEAQCEE